MYRPVAPVGHGIMFHHFFDDVHPKGQGAISQDELDRMISFIGRERILNAQEWLERAESGGLREDDIVLTFDDGLLCQYELAEPVLAAHGLTACWFVYSSVFRGNIERLEIYRYFRTVEFDSVDEYYDEYFGFLKQGEFGKSVSSALAAFDPSSYLADLLYLSNPDRAFRYVRDIVLGPVAYFSTMDSFMAHKGRCLGSYNDRLWMNNDQLAGLVSKGHVVGLHSYSHPTRLADLSKADQVQEYKENRKHLIEVSGVSPKAMSHPCNSYTAETLDLLRDLGVACGFRANMAMATASKLELPRENHVNVLRQMRAQ